MYDLAPFGSATLPQATENGGLLSLSPQDWDIIKLLIKIGAVGTVVSLPIGLWAIKKWPDKPIIPAIILTAVGLAIKELMLSHGEEEEPAGTELHDAPALAGYARYPVYVPARLAAN